MRAEKRKQQNEGVAKIRRPDWRHLLYWLFALLLFALMGSGAAWGVMRLSDPRVLPLKVVRIDGDFRYLDRAALERAVSSVMSGNFFTVDLEAVRRAALGLPWVHQVTVRRIWPHTLGMEVEEQVPLARWGSDGLVNTDGEVFTPESGPIPDRLPWLEGPPGSSREVTRQFLGLRLRLADMELQLDRVKLNPRRSWTLSFAQGFEMRVGNARLDERLGRFMRIYPALRMEEGRRMKQVDLRYTNGVTVLWAEIPKDTNDTAAGTTGDEGGDSPPHRMAGRNV